MPDERYGAPARVPLSPASSLRDVRMGRMDSEDAYADYPPNEPEAEPFEQTEFEEDFPLEERFDEAPDNLPVEPPMPRGPASPYARPVSESGDGVSDASARFAPPPKFELPRASAFVDRGDAFVKPSSPSPNVYQTRRTAMEEPVAAGSPYRVEAEQVRRREKKGHGLRNTLIVLLALCLLAGGAYLGRDWLMEQYNAYFGETPAAVRTENASDEVLGYVPAPALKLAKRARQGVEAVASGLALDLSAVTEKNVVERVMVGEGLYDYYLFTSDSGKLLGYFDALRPDEFLVQPDDCFYVAMPPYLIDSAGNALISQDTRDYVAGEGARLSPMAGGWSIISDAAGERMNYINADGALLSPLWFCEAYPFTGERTVAYVDTGNIADPEERYALYLLTREGEMTLWKHAANTDEVLGSACDTVYLSTGEVVLLDDAHTVLCVSDDVTVYADCDALAARDPSTGLYALYVHNEQHYDYAYSAIAPAAKEITWASLRTGGFTLCAVSGADYPQALSYHFALTKADGTRERVALSTVGSYPVALDLERQAQY